MCLFATDECYVSDFTTNMTCNGSGLNRKSTYVKYFYETFSGNSVSLVGGSHSTTPPSGWVVDNNGTEDGKDGNLFG